MTKPLSKRLLELDALRGIAAISVVLFHMTMKSSHESLLFNYGLTGVDLFFMISGFVILMTINSVANPKQFIIGRFIRLYPLYWVAVTLSAISFLMAGSMVVNGPFSLKYLANLTMFQPYLLKSHLDGVYWTLIVEMMFYLVMLCGLYYKKIDRLEVVGTICLIVLFAYGIYFSSHLGVWTTRIHRFISLTNYLPLFLSGIVYYNLKFGSKTVFRYIILLLCFITQLSLFHLEPDRAHWFSYNFYAIPLIIYNCLFLLYVFDKLQFLRVPMLVFLGTISYPIYLIHNSIYRLLSISGLYNLGFWPAVAITLGTIILVAYLLHISIEKPSLKYLKSKLLKSRPESKTVMQPT